MKFNNRSKNQSGQILVEYILLLVIAVVCATLLIKGLVGRTENSEGVIIREWNRILVAMGHDLPTCEKQTNFSKADCP